MKYLFFINALCFAFFATQAQTLDRQVIASSGQYFENSNFNVQATIGETVIPTLTSGNVILTQGFQQPDSTVTVNVENTLVSLGFSLFPNPTATQFSLYLKSDKAITIVMQLFDLQGKEITQAKTVSFQNTFTEVFDIQQLAAGQYTLRLQDKTGKMLKSINVQKIK